MKSLAVVASGMVTPIGFDAPATLAALRAGVSAISRVPWVDPETGGPLRGAKVALPQWWEGVGKLADLVAPAIEECLREAGPTPARDIPVLIGVAPPDRPARTAGCEAELLKEVEARLGGPLHRDSAIFATGQTACAHGLMHADALLNSAVAPMCIVAGVDSYLQQPTLDFYIKQRRVMTASNSNGFFPGEAGSAVLVTTPQGAAGRPALRILGFGIAMETAAIGSTKPLRAIGLTQAVRESLKMARIEMKDVAFRLTDLSGEHYKFKEASFVATRLDRGPRAEPLPLWHPSEFLGEIGAAILPCLLAWAMHAQRKDYAPGPIALSHVGNDAGERCALVTECGFAEE